VNASAEASCADDLLRRRVIFVLGKGGVGRTAASAAVALVAAARGMRTLIIETDPQRAIAATYGRKPGLQPVVLESHLSALFLGGQESLEDYLGLVVPRPILRAVLASSLYQYFVNAAPALRELTMMGKIYHEIERRPKDQEPWDLIVVDAPASGQALGMLRMPFAARQSFGEGMVGSEAGEVAGFFRDAVKCGLAIVTTAEALAVSETLEIHHALEQLQLATAAVIFNRASAGEFEATDITRLMRHGARNDQLKHLVELAEIARAELRRRTRERRAIGILQRQIKAPIALLQERRGLAGRPLAAALAAQMQSTSASVRA
jgi:anion-transporting  ArsA/GET3 family ATPase